MARIFDIDTPPENIPDKPKKNSFGWRIPSQQELRPVEGFATEPEPAEASGLAGFVDSFTTGVGNVGRTAQATAATYAGDLGTVEKTAKRNAAVPKAKENAEFMRDYAARIAKSKGEKDDVGLLDAIGDFAAAAWANPTGAAQAMVEQLPNAAPILAGGMAGAKAGAVVGTMVAPGIGTAIGTAVGAFGGMFLGNAMIETGSKAMEKADRGFTEKERSEAIHEGATKGAVIAGIDLATLGIGGRAMKLIGGAAVKAGAMAEAKVLLDAGVDVTSASAIKAALATDSELLATAKAAGNAAAKAELSTAAKAGRAATGLTLETVGEGSGEYLGEVAATGKGNVSDAVMEGFMGAGQSSIETAHNYNKAHSTGDAGLISRAGQTLADAQQEPTGQPPSTPPAPPPVDTNPDLQMQNRDRGTAASVVQMKSIANAPDFDRLGASPIADVGAPLVSIKDNADGALDQGDIGTGGTITLPDGAKVDFRYAVVDANAVLASHDATGRGNPDYGNPQPGQIVALTNGRMAGLQEAYKIGTASQPGGYMDRLMEDAATFGIQVESITGKEAPVLVRLYDDAVNARPDIGKMSNAGGSMRMSAQEVARNDARILPDVSSLVIGEHGDLESPENQPFLRGFVHALPANERSEVLDREGRLSQVGMRRIRNAIIHRAYGESSVFGRLVESLDSGMANLSKALVRAAPKVARVKDLMAAGAARDMDVTATLIKAVAEIETMRKNGLSMADFLAQARMFDQLSPELVEVLAFLDANLRSPNRIAAFIELYYQKIEALGDPRTLDMFGAPQISSANVLKMAATAATREVQDDGVNEAGAGLGGGTGSGEILTTNASGTPGGETTPRLPGADQPGAAVVQQPASPASSTEGATAGVEDGATGRADAAVDREGAAAEPDQPAGSVAAQRPVGSSGSDADRPDGSAGKSVSGSREDSPARTDDRGEKAVNGTGQKIVNELKRAKKKKADQHAASDKFDAGGLQPGTPEYNAAFDAWLANRESSMVADANKRQRDENRAAIEKRNKWRKLVRDWFESASDGDSITDVTGQEYRIIEKTRKDGTRTKTLVAVDENGNPLPDGRAATGISKVGDRVHGLQDGVLDEDTGSSAPESSPQSFAASLGQQLESGEAKTGKGISIQQQKAVAPSAQTVTAPSTAPEHVPADASRPADDGAAQWNALTPAGRRAAMKAAGVKLPDAVMWEHISDANKQKLRPVVSNMLEHAAEPQAATSPAPAPSPAPAATKADARSQSGSASEPPLREASPKQDAEPNLEAVRALLAEQKAATGNPKAEAEVRRKARELASKTPISDEKTVLALDLIATRLGMGDGNKKALEFLPAKKQAEPAPASDASKADPFAGNKLFTSDKVAAAPTSASERYNALVKRWNDLVSSYQAADDQGKAAIKQAMDLLDAEMKAARGDILLDGKRQAAEAQARARDQLQQELAAMPVGARMRPSEFGADAGIFWEKTGDNEWTARGDWFKKGQTRTNAELAERGGLVEMPAETKSTGKKIVEELKAKKTKRVKKLPVKEDTSQPAKDDLGAMFDEILAEETAAEARKLLAEMDAKKAAQDLKAALAPKEKKPVTPQIMSNGEFKTSLGIAADSIEQLRKIDVYRVITSTPAIFRTDMAGRIKAARPDLAQEVDEVMAEAGAPAQANPGERTAGEAAVSAAKNTAAGLSDAIDGLGKLFGGPGTLGMGPVFNEDTYAKAKPLFQQAIAHFKDAGTDIKEAMRAVVRLVMEKFGPQVTENMKPYIVRFAEDVRDGNIVYDESKETENHASDLQADAVPEGSAGQAPADAATRRGNRKPLGAGMAGDGGGTGASGDLFGSPDQSGAAGARSPDDATGDESPGAPRDRAGDGVEPGAAGDVTDHIIDAEDIGKGGLSKKYRDNLAAIRILKAMADEGRVATPEERNKLAKYVGWGAIKGVFDPANRQWATQHAELKALLTEAEFAAARKSTLDAHYTSPVAVGAMYDALARMGVTGGRILEPSVGIGNFFGLMPEELRRNAQLHGVELDSLTARMVAALYPKAKITQGGFEDFSIPAEYFDVVIGNPPFGSQPLVDMARSPYSGFSIHNYFLAKGIDKLRPGGIMQVVVSHNFLDAQDVRARRWISDRADLIGGVRLPNTAFKENAGTEVVTDILIFQKRAGGVAVKTPTWIEVADQANTNPKTDETVTHKVGRYFIDNPQNVLGTPSAAGTMYTSNEYTVEPNGDLEAQLAKWVKTLPAGIFSSIDRSADGKVVDMEVPDGIKEGSFYVNPKGEVMQRGADEMGIKTAVPWVPKNAAVVERMKGMIALRDTLREQMRLERSLDAPMDKIEANRAKLNRLYDAFVKKFKHLNSTTNRNVFFDDTEAHLLQALEFDYDKGISAATAANDGIEPREPSAVKADIFTRRVAFPPQGTMTVTTAKDALLASLNYRGRVDQAYIESIYPHPMEDVVAELGDLLFEDPQAGLMTADEYLSGDVKTKLAEAQDAAKHNPALRRNVEALEKIIPADKLPSEITVNIGATYIPVEIYQQFIKHITGSGANLYYIKATGQWSISFIGRADAALNIGKFGTTHLNAQQLFELTTMGRGAIVKQTVRNPDGTTSTFVLEKETESAREKQNAIKAEWQKWLWEDAARGEQIAEIYNDTMNRTVNRKFDGAHMTFPGMNPGITLLEHQKNGVWRGLQSFQTLYDHVVGAGKTFIMSALSMEMRRTGIARKPLFVVPNHLTLQWRSEFTRLYPGSNVLAATPEDFSKEKRTRLFSKIVTGDWDAVVIGHSSLKKIGLPEATEKAVIDEQINELSDAIEEMKRSRGDRNIIRDIEGIKARLEAKAKVRLAAIGQRDKVLTFDELGIDALFVDEMHEFKNLNYHSTMDRNPGMGNPAGSSKAFDMFVKVRWLFETFGEKAPFITATGTPISNSLVEMYNMQRYMQYPTLKAHGLHVFDAWARQFGKVESVYEVSPSGSGFRQSNRFAKFTNLPALMALYNSFADTITLDDLKAQEAAQGKVFPVPKMVGGKPQNIVAKRSPQVAAFMGIPKAKTDEAGNILFNADLNKDITIDLVGNTGKYVAKVGDAYLGTFETEQEARLKVAEAALSPNIEIDPKSIVGMFANLRELMKDTNGRVNALSITGEANKAGLDYRLINPAAPDFAGSKINLAIGKMMEIYHQWSADKGTQLVFCDLSVPLSARSSYGSKARRLYVKVDGAIEMKRGTLHAVDGFESLPFFIVTRGEKEARRFDIFDAASGVRLAGDFRTKPDALEAMQGAAQDDSKRQIWIDMRTTAGDIDQAEIDEYNNDHSVETEGVDAFGREEIAGMSGSAKFSVYDDIKAKLMARGVPEREIAFIHDYATPVSKAKLFAAVNAGSIRFLLGSTPKLGAGTNVQKRLVGLHHIDAPWRPSDLEQREGRIIRRNNDLYARDPDGFEVFIGRYATEQTYDTRRWQILEHKARGIEQLRNYDGSTNEIDDIDGEAANSADMKAAASGDPLILEETRARNDVRRLEQLQAGHADEVQAMTRRARDIRTFLNDDGPKRLARLEALIATTKQHPADDKGHAPVTIDGKKYTDNPAMDNKIAMVFGEARTSEVGTEGAKIKYRGLDFDFFTDCDYTGSILVNVGGPTSASDIGSWGKEDTFSPRGFVQRLVNYVERLPANAEQVKAEMARAANNATSLREQAGKPFEYAADLIAARETHKKVQRALMRKGPDVPDAQKPAVAAAIEHQKQRLDDLGFGDAVRELLGGVGETKFSRTKQQEVGAGDAAIKRMTEAEAESAGFTMKAYRGVSKANPYNDSGTVWMTTSKDQAEAYAEEVFGYDDAAVIELRVKPDGLPVSDMRKISDEDREALGVDGFGNPQKVGIYRNSDDGPLGSGYRQTVIHAPASAVVEVSDDTNPDIRYARGNRGGVHADDMAAAVKTLRAAFPGLEFHPLEHENKAPDELRKDIKAAGAGGDVAGALYKGEVYLFQSSLRDAQDVIDRGIHEATHAGLERMFGTALDPLLLDIHQANVKVQLRAARIKAKYGYSPVRSVEEVLADMGPEAKSLKGWQKLVAWVRSKLRAAGLVNEWRDSDIEALVLRALAAAKKPADTHIARGSVFAEKPVTIDEKPKFSRTEQPEPEPSSIDIRNATLQRVEEILRRKASGETIIDTMIRVPMQAVGIDKVTRLGGKVVRKIIDVAPESIKAGMVSDYGNPDDAINHRDAMFGHQRRRLRGVAELMERMAVMSREESRVAYEWLNNRNADELLESLPEKSRADMIEIKQQIDDIGKEAVDLGLLSVDAYEAHKGAYVHRSYRKWDIDSTKGERTSREYTKQILGEQFKTRGLTELVPMVRVQNTNPTFWKRKIKTGTADHGLRGEQFIRFERHKKAVGTASLPGVEGAEQAGKVVEVQYWPASEPVPARYGAWHQAGTFTVRGTKGDKLIMNRDWTKSEREKMGEIDEARYAIAKTFHQMIHDIEVAKYLQWIAGHYGKEVPPRGVIPVKASESMRNVFGKDDWVQVPNSTVGDTTIKRYGKLSGLYIPGPIWNDIRQVANHNYQPFGETYANILKAWKLSKTALSPGVHINNIMSNFVMADWHDVRAGDVLEALHIIVRQKDPANKELLGRFEDSGGTIGMYTLSEIKRDQLEPLIEQLRADVAKVGELHGMVGAGAALQSLLHGRMKEAYEIARSTKSGRMSASVVKKMMDLYEDEDTVFRLAAFIKAKRNGATDLEAGKIARRSFLDYHINAPWIQAMRQTAFPFISFTYRAVPMLLEIIETKPWKIAKLAAFAGLLNALGYALSGGDEDKERRYLPNEKSGRVWGIVPKLIRMPWNDANDSPVFLDIRRWIPVGDVLDTGQSHAALPLIPVVIPGGPVALLAELLANKSQFTGKEITKRTDTAGEKTAAVIEHLFKAFAPNLFFLPGTYAATSVVNAGTGRTDVFGREQSVGMALASGIGIKLAAYPTDVLQRNATLELKGQLREINENMYGLGRERAVGGLSDADFSRKIQRESEKRKRLVEEFQRR